MKLANRDNAVSRALRPLYGEAGLAELEQTPPERVMDLYVKYAGVTSEYQEACGVIFGNE